MLKILSRLMGKNRTEIIDARRIYQKTMAQSRESAFYGDDLCPDSTDGRMEILCLHLSTIMFALRAHGDTGAKLTQAIYDVMIQDFDVALREEGLSDTGVSRRIKPLASMFFARAKSYAAAFESREDTRDLVTAIIEEHVCKQGQPDNFAKYTVNFLNNLQAQGLGDIAQGKLNFPKFQ